MTEAEGQPAQPVPFPDEEEVIKTLKDLFDLIAFKAAKALRHSDLTIGGPTATIDILKRGLEGIVVLTKEYLTGADGQHLVAIVQDPLLLELAAWPSWWINQPSDYQATNDDMTDAVQLIGKAFERLLAFKRVHDAVAD